MRKNKKIRENNPEFELTDDVAETEISGKKIGHTLHDKLRGYVVVAKQARDSFTEKVRGGKTVLLGTSF